jgi:hypothetical protein
MRRLSPQRFHRPVHWPADTTIFSSVSVKRKEREMKGQTTHITKCLLIAATLFVAAVASPLVASAGNPNPGVLLINSSPYGKSYGSWTEAWWQWVLSIPAAQNPELDTTGQDAGIGQSGPVWFMSATFGNLPNVVRTFTIPAGKTLFLPVYPWIFGASAGDCEPSSPGVPCDVPTLRDLAAAAATT